MSYRDLPTEPMDITRPGENPRNSGIAAPLSAGSAPHNRRRIASQTLFDGQVEIDIQHFEQVYRLRQTSLGKLILTK